MQKERGVHTKRIQALLFAQGIATEVKPKLFDNLGSLRTADGRALPEELIARIRREQSRLELAQEHLRELQKERQTQIAQGTGATAERMGILMPLCGIGCTASFRLVVEFFGLHCCTSPARSSWPQTPAPNIAVPTGAMFDASASSLVQ